MESLEGVSDYEGACTASESSGRSIREILDRVGDKWSLLIVVTLEPGPLRFNALRRHIPGISQRMLTLTLRQLERDGLVTRSVFASVPARVDYELTPIGATLAALAHQLAAWAIENQPAIEQARTAYDAASATGTGTPPTSAVTSLSETSRM